MNKSVIAVVNRKTNALVGFLTKHDNVFFSERTFNLGLACDVSDQSLRSCGQKKHCKCGDNGYYNKCLTGRIDDINKTDKHCLYQLWTVDVY